MILPVLVWVELTMTVLRLPCTTTFRLLPMAVAPPMFVPPEPDPLWPAETPALLLE
ncbi:hypothetical protein D3C79_1035040 [compost metagenome]